MLPDKRPLRVFIRGPKKTIHVLTILQRSHHSVTIRESVCLASEAVLILRGIEISARGE